MGLKADLDGLSWQALPASWSYVVYVYVCCTTMLKVHVVLEVFYSNTNKKQFDSPQL